ncbi:nitrilotriacetate monooxygenase [Acetobacter senegalensis]|uniref:Nitrilotriacetate monooxygenase n=1 Tax=Acetobacter senegalensis TaxID=446692 RepID=A0A149U077_9PROT|nr:LLM class flavin-dependent oxidoreductase [Acetobacter senegalensis]KXV58782.1 nitrilotriacetate monooxygenase [Acetobacter senegalensis]MCG4256730.1 LLM class flavin-dependent oxidoreductase [Acetobacter senegalensis]MCG4266709.1 LLM class flavin-dependent oxidoreductase [Acetobacter senegalensis]
MSKQMHLGVFVQATGHHVSGWRVPEAETGSENLALLQKIAAIAERGKFDLFFLADGLTSSLTAHPSTMVRFEPTTLLGAIAMSTRHIGLAATVSTTYSEPYQVARTFASLDHLSNGRAAWNVVTTSYARSAANFTRSTHPGHDNRYEIAEEFVDVCKGLWDSWDDGAIVADKTSGTFALPSKMHQLNHKGQFFTVQGPLNASRPPQGHPIIIQAGSSVPGQNLAARTADIVFTAQGDLAEAQAFYASLKGRLVTFGRERNDLVVMPGVFPVIGRDEKEVEENYQKLKELTDLPSALGLLSERLGHDVTQFDLDGPLPADLAISDEIQSRGELLKALALRENMTVRELALHVGMARGHNVLKGTPSVIADHLQQWFESNAADGFNIMPAWFPGQFELFVDYVVPELQKRGLFRKEYEGATLRDILGLERPQNSFVSKV